MQMSKDELLKQLEKDEDRYNPEVGLLRIPLDGPGYHTTLTKEKTPFVHTIRESLTYAHRLLESGIPAYGERAPGIIDRVLKLQETDPSKSTYGIWPWFWEESLDEMSPPDWNWADFLGKRLLLILFGHEDRLAPALKERMGQAIFRACDAIIKRNVGPHYTNIAIMGAMVTLLAGERFGRTDYLDYGLRRLETFHAYTARTGNFEEFNSPTYTSVAIEEILDLDRHVRHPRAKALCAELLRLAWGTVTGHYHVPTGQWSGPHSRCYQSILQGYPYDFLYRLDGCPEDLTRLLSDPAPRELKDLVKIQQEEPSFRIHAYTYMDERVSLGTFDREIMWNQRRNLIAYMNNGRKPGYVQLRFLKDGRDFASAVFLSAQRKLDVLFGIGFATDGGDWTPVMDMVHGAFEAHDLRLRLEVGGSLDGVELPKPAGPAGSWELQLDAVKLKLQCGPGEFLGQRPADRWEISRSPDRICLDFVFYSGARQGFRLQDMERAFFTAALTLGTDPETPALRAAEELAGVVELRLPAGAAGVPLELRMPVKPGPIHAYYHAREQSEPKSEGSVRP
ncbi:hypothetical protein [Gorillibacterium sp. sgz5001074]|uniref:hypothetical protein n=1 Tax=Gorillibacterium sp. sgz5001074 TaxID=3446695 RepID=UPI003F668400